MGIEAQFDYTDSELGIRSDTDIFAALAEDPDNEELRHRGGHLLVDEARHWWSERSLFRADRKKNRDYYASRQWEQAMTNPATGAATTEKEYIESQGRVALVMNILSNVVNNVEGQFRQNKSERLAFAVDRKDEEATRMVNLARRAMRRYNESHVIEADQFKEHVLSGSSCFKSSFEFDPILGRHEARDYEVDQTRLFYNLDIHDRRFRGLRTIGELHDVTMNDLIAQLGRGRKDDARIREMYARGNDASELIFDGTAGFDTIDGLDFHGPVGSSMVRVLEIWKPVYQWVRIGLDPLFADIPEGYGEIALPEAQITRIQNARRERGLPLMELDEPRLVPMWHAFYCTPHGQIISHNPTPYRHASHPYSPNLAMLIDGETWGLLTPLRDPQRWLNRLLTNIDHMMGAGAKGATTYDRAFLEGTDLKQKDVDEWYTSANGSLGINVPQGKSLSDFIQAHKSNSLPAGYFELLPLLIGFTEKISGVSSEAQGMSVKSGTPASLYQQQVMQSAINVLPFQQTYFEGLRRKDRKDIQVIQQILSDPRMVADTAMGDMVMIDPERIKDVDWDFAMGDVADTATYRQLFESDLMQFWQAGALPFETMLQASSHPRADYLLQLLKSTQAAMTPEMLAMAQPTR